MDGLLDAVKIIMGENTHLVIENHYLGAYEWRYGTEPSQVNNKGSVP